MVVRWWKLKILFRPINIIFTFHAISRNEIFDGNLVVEWKQANVGYRFVRKLGRRERKIEREEVWKLDSNEVSRVYLPLERNRKKLTCPRVEAVEPGCWG